MRDYALFPLNKMVVIKNEYNARRGLWTKTTTQFSIASSEKVYIDVHTLEKLEAVVLECE